MKALVLAAGVGERLRPLTLETPKPLLMVGGRPLIHYPILMLKRAGITEIAINVHHLAGQIESALGDGHSLGVRITYSPEPALLGTGGPLIALREYFGEESFVVANSDSILDLDASQMIEFHSAMGSLVTIALHRPANLDYYSRIEIDGHARIRRMRLVNPKSPGGFDDYPRHPNRPAAALEPYMYCGLYICEPRALDLAAKAPPFSSFRDLIAPMVAQGLPLFGFVHHGLFRTVDDLAGYEQLRRDFESAPPRLRYLET